jgi:hypothetical protein
MACFLCSWTSGALNNTVNFLALVSVAAPGRARGHMPGVTMYLASDRSPSSTFECFRRSSPPRQRPSPSARLKSGARDRMITPQFTLSQTDKHLNIEIRTPHIKVAFPCLPSPFHFLSTVLTRISGTRRLALRRRYVIHPLRNPILLTVSPIL